MDFMLFSSFLDILLIPAMGASTIIIILILRKYFNRLYGLKKYDQDQLLYQIEKHSKTIQDKIIHENNNNAYKIEENMNFVKDNINKNTIDYFYTLQNTFNDTIDKNNISVDQTKDEINYNLNKLEDSIKDNAIDYFNSIEQSIKNSIEINNNQYNYQLSNIGDLKESILSKIK